MQHSDFSPRTLPHGTWCLHLHCIFPSLRVGTADPPGRFRISPGTAAPRITTEMLLGHCCQITSGPQSLLGAFGASTGSELFSPSGRLFSVGAVSYITPRGLGQHPVIKPAMFLHETCDCSYPVGKNETINSL